MTYIEGFWGFGFLGFWGIESPETANAIQIPDVYSDLSEVFSKLNATKLPPHCTYDCAIHLIEGATLPKSRVYPLL